jgi:hypothetical protein
MPIYQLSLVPCVLNGSEADSCCNLRKSEGLFEFWQNAARAPAEKAD